MSMKKDSPYSIKPAIVHRGDEVLPGWALIHTKFFFDGYKEQVLARHLSRAAIEELKTHMEQDL